MERLGGHGLRCPPWLESDAGCSTVLLEPLAGVIVYRQRPSSWSLGDVRPGKEGDM